MARTTIRWPPMDRGQRRSNKSNSIVCVSFNHGNLKIQAETARSYTKKPQNKRTAWDYDQSSQILQVSRETSAKWGRCCLPETVPETGSYRSQEFLQKAGSGLQCESRIADMHKPDGVKMSGKNVAAKVLNIHCSSVIAISRPEISRGESKSPVDAEFSSHGEAELVCFLTGYPRSWLGELTLHDRQVSKRFHFSCWVRA